MTKAGGLIKCLLVIDFPDERTGGRHSFDHMHAWFTDPNEAQALQRKLEVVGGRHKVIDGAICPFCGQWPGGRG